MIEPHVHIAIAPRGAGLLCALFYFVRERDVFGWFTGARAHEFPASFFMLERYFSTQETACYRSVANDVYGGWVAATSARDAGIDRPVPVPEPVCHELERLQDAFAREWLFYADDPGHAAEAAAFAARELSVLPVNVRPHKLAKLVTGRPVWTYSSPGTDPHVVRYLAKRWRIDYQPD